MRGYAAQLRAWPRRRWLVAAATTVLYTLLVAVPTDLVDTPLFWREVPPTWWSWPALVASSALAGVLTASYVAAAGPVPDAEDRPRRGGLVGGVLTYFAVGCPVCNKLVLLALGSAGAMTWFEPFQPVLQVLALAVLLWALCARLRGEIACRLAPTVSETA
ncbi:MAG: hypothetical protein ACTHKG_08305 [Nocardioides sp.]